MTSTAAKPLLSHHHVTAATNPQSGEAPVRWRGPGKNSDFVNGNGAASGGGPPKKPSYVGLSCSVSGYGPANRYTSPDGRRTSPEQIPVRNGPQILDSVGLVLNSMRQQQASNNNNSSSMKNGHDVTDRSYFASSSSTTTTRVFSSYREPSPGSDSGSSSAGSGNLVQKQIERIYGGRVQSISATSPPDSDDAMSPPHAHGDSSATPQRKSSGGFFSRKFGLSKQKDKDRRMAEEERSRNGSGGGGGESAPSSPLDFKPLKVPAVFRLLRPEFREQLKSNSCQIPGDRTSPVKEPNSSAAKDTSPAKKERVIPVVVENGAAAKKPATTERVIPIQRTSERIADIAPPPPASKPTSLPVTVTNEKSASSSSPLDPEASHSVTSPGLVMSSGIMQQPPKSVSPKPVEEAPAPPTPTRRSESPPPPQHSPQRSFDSTGESGPTLVQEPILEVEGEEEEEEELAVTAEDFDPAAAGGIHERAQLCTILEEDNESTASGSQCNLVAAKMNYNGGAPTAAKRSSTLSNGNGVEQEVHDGHYFIKLIENECFKFEEQICDFEDDSTNPAVPDDIRDSILAAIGKARLLMAQKLAQFRGLCEKNITLTVVEDPHVPTNDDLAGFWDMVYIQVEHIYALFKELTKIRENGWKKSSEIGGVDSSSLISPSTPTTNKPKPTRRSATPQKKKTPSPGGGSGTSSPADGAKSAAAKARDEARKKMLEEKKRNMLKMKKEQAAKAAAASGDADGSGALFVEF